MIGLSMRRMRWIYPNGNIEIRDSLDVRWWKFLQLALPCYPFFPLPNIGSQIKDTLEAGNFSGFILTGGDDWEIFPDRDMTETAIFEYAAENSLPLLGVCRGAQIINHFFNGVNCAIANHAGTRHEIYLNKQKKRLVNSFHNNGIKTLGAGLKALAQDERGFVEAFTDNDGIIQGIMWHPEREEMPDRADLDLFINLFSKADT